MISINLTFVNQISLFSDKFRKFRCFTHRKLEILLNRSPDWYLLTGHIFSFDSSPINLKTC
jgi:hypothetical protein